jgi:hypothetical protein
VVVIVFFGMGLLAYVAFAIFLILKLGLPYTGLLRVSPAALQEAIRRLSPTLTSRSRLPTLPARDRRASLDFRLNRFSPHCDDRKGEAGDERMRDS